MGCRVSYTPYAMSPMVKLCDTKRSGTEHSIREALGGTERDGGGRDVAEEKRRSGCYRPDGLDPWRRGSPAPACLVVGLATGVADGRPGVRWRLPRSEERRVGKECRSRWSP